MASLIDQTKEAAKGMVSKNNDNATASATATTLPSSSPTASFHPQQQQSSTAGLTSEVSSSTYRTPSPTLSSIMTDPAPDADSASSSPIFFKSFVFSPEVPIRIDYHGRHVDMQQGPLIGLLVGLTHLTDSQVTLKRIAFRFV